MRIMAQLDKAKEQFKRYGHMTTNDAFNKMDADAAEIARLSALVDTIRTKTISEIIQYLESEGHGIPAEKVRARFGVEA